jgi:cytochrome c oxidase assembly factor CtaG/polyferredoxin
LEPLLDAFLHSWPCDAWLCGSLLVVGAIYVRGWRRLRRSGSGHFTGARLAAFGAGLLTLILALNSPLEPFSALLLTAHMTQHLLLMMVAPPLLLLGAPALPLMRGLPGGLRRHWLIPVLRIPGVMPGLRALTAPPLAWLAFVGFTWVWHAPPLYELALRSDRWHYLQHVCFFASGLLFWWPLVRPYPSRPVWNRWILVPYLLLADVQNTALSALLAFSGKVLYPHYAAVPRLAGFSALDDQATAAALMWVPGSLLFLVPLACLVVQLLYGSTNEQAVLSRDPRKPPARGQRVPLPVLATASAARRDASFDLLHVPVIGTFLGWRHARACLQTLTLLLAAAVILDGLFGPTLAPMNLAGVLPWLHWRGLVVIVLLAAGNFFCTACPFLLPRTLARRWLPRGWAWPRRLRGKWLAVALLVLFFTTYEVYDLWDRPAWTAWIALGYFAAAFVVDTLFRDAAFCKYVCPIGQFQFVQSLASPLEVQVRDRATCHSCTTKDCLHGNDEAPGCELKLFLPRKAGNMDCTFCLDCIHACPHDNVGIIAVPPGESLWRDPHRSGIGRFASRPDLVALVLVLVFAAFANAAGMIAPIVNVAGSKGVMAVALPASLVLVPGLLVGAAALASRRLSRIQESPARVAARFAFCLVPLGAGMWLAHYLYHFLIGASGLWPVAQRIAGELGWPFLGRPIWRAACCLTPADWLLPLEIICLDLGLLLSLYCGYRIARERYGAWPRALPVFAPWATLILLLFAFGLWVLFQPMQMRGTLEMAG